MTHRRSAIRYLVWALCLIPVALVMVWFEMTDASWRGFFNALGGLVVISAVFELFYSGGAWLWRRFTGRGDPPTLPTR